MVLSIVSLLFCLKFNHLASLEFQPINIQRDCCFFFQFFFFLFLLFFHSFVLSFHFLKIFYGCICAVDSDEYILFIWELIDEICMLFLSCCCIRALLCANFLYRSIQHFVKINHVCDHHFQIHSVCYWKLFKLQIVSLVCCFILDFFLFLNTILYEQCTYSFIWFRLKRIISSFSTTAS